MNRVLSALYNYSFYSLNTNNVPGTVLATLHIFSVVSGTTQKRWMLAMSHLSERETGTERQSHLPRFIHTVVWNGLIPEVQPSHGHSHTRGLCLPQLTL